MNNFKIVTDSTADLPEEYVQKNNIGVLYLTCLFGGKVYNKNNRIDDKEFYDLVRAGEMPTTSQVNPEEAKNELLEFMKENKNILCLAFSSGLSGTYQSINIAAEEIMEEDKEANIIVIDTLSASLGEGLLVNKAVSLMNEGKSLEEVADFINEHKLNLCHMFTVDDLNHLYRGGRVNKATAVLGTMIGIKPLLHVDNEGHLINIGKCRGRRKSLTSLVDMMEERIGSYRNKNDIIYISHGDCEEDAKIVADEIKTRFGYEAFLINYVGPVIGTHSGPGTVALFFFGDQR